MKPYEPEPALAITADSGHPDPRAIVWVRLMRSGGLGWDGRGLISNSTSSRWSRSARARSPLEGRMTAVAGGRCGTGGGGAGRPARGSSGSASSAHRPQPPPPAALRHRPGAQGVAWHAAAAGEREIQPAHAETNKGLQMNSFCGDDLTRMRIET